MPQTIRKEKKKISLRQIFNKGKSIGGIIPREALVHALPEGSVTLEAALVLPLFLFAVSALLSLFLLMQAQYIVGNSLDHAVSDTALLRKNKPGEVETLMKAAFYKELAKQKCPFSLIQGKAAGFSWKNTSVDGAYIDAFVTYQVRFPISFFGIKTMKVSDSCRMHRWTGWSEDGTGSGQETWVYVTPTQSVYHRSRNCSHLKLSIQSVNAKALKAVGGSYSACGHCAKGKKATGTVYVTEKGDCYHVRIDCSGLKRTIYMVKISQVGGKRSCSRCGG